MLVNKVRNVGEAYIAGLGLLVRDGLVEDTRAGSVLVSQEPLTTVYERPYERVLFDMRRDANPFFHLMEAVWMMAGRQDATWLDRYVSDFSSRFAETDGNAHGAYGHRWRHKFGVDQIFGVVSMLQDDPTTRRAVISMWDPIDDLGANKRDVPCNDLIMFRARSIREEFYTLDMTVSCRSNDAVWGAFGANAVHMSVLHEVIADMSGMGTGRLYQISNNFHVYKSVLDKIWPPVQCETYEHQEEQPVSIDARPETFLPECELLCKYIHDDVITGTRIHLTNNWLRQTVLPMARAHMYWRNRDRELARRTAETIESWDWRMAALQWMERRVRRDKRVEEAREE